MIAFGRKKIELNKKKILFSTIVKDQYSNTEIIGQNSNYKNIFLFIMEGETLESFRSAEIKVKGSIIEKLNTQLFSRYFTLNQDSRTAVFSMLFSRFLPIRPYVNFDLPVYYDLYNVNKKDNNKGLLGKLDLLNFKKIFFLSRENKNMIGEIPLWDSVFTTRSLNKKTKDKFKCFKISGLESSCEDSIFFESLKKEVIKANEKKQNLFVVQELLYGHSYHYRKALNITQTEYLLKYIEKIYRFTKERNISNDTLFIITSDHGIRRGKQLFQRNNYNMPLLFISEKIRSEIDNRFLSHLDFQNLILNKVLGERSQVEHESFFTIGPSTKEPFIGYIEESGYSIFVNKTTLEASTYYENASSQIDNIIFNFDQYKDSFLKKYKDVK